MTDSHLSFKSPQLKLGILWHEYTTVSVFRKKDLMNDLIFFLNNRTVKRNEAQALFVGDLAPDVNEYYLLVIEFPIAQFLNEMNSLANISILLPLCLQCQSHN